MPLGRASAATVLGAVLVLALSGGAGGAAGATGPGSPWSQTGYNAAQSRANLTEQTLTASTVGRVRYLRGIASPQDQPGQSGCNINRIVAPVLTGGRLYAVTNGRLAKYNPATGGLIWRRALLDPITKESSSLDAQSLAVAGGLVVVGDLYCGSVSDPEGFIQAFSASTGARAWSQQITPEGGALDQMGVSGSYIAAAGTSPGGGQVVSVHQLATGALVWSRLTDECAPGTVLVVAQMVISYGCTQSLAARVTARNIATGALAWSRTGNWVLQRGDIGGTAGHHVYATSPSGTVVSLDPLTGTAQYSLPGAAGVLAVDTTRAYATCGGLGVCAYSTATGARLWSTQPGFIPALAAEAGGVLYLDQGRALNAATGKTAASLWITSSPASALAVGDGRIAVVTDPRVLDLYGPPGS
jgi:outer membrane protein assembly factor BamB